MHQSAGAIIKNKEGQILMIDRKQYPFGWACPAGHIEDGEKPEEAMIRETREEIGLTVISNKLLIHEFVDWNKCSRGIQGHEWFVYEVTWEGEIKQNRKEEKDLKWVSLNKLNKLELEPVWHYWFKKLKII